MIRKRPCRICRKWFEPHPRAGCRQRVCSREDCQRERHRRACAAWRERDGPGEREERLRRRLVRQDNEAVPRQNVDPLSGLDWSAVRDAVGLEVAVVIEESGKLLVGWTRDTVHTQVIRTRRGSKRYGR